MTQSTGGRVVMLVEPPNVPTKPTTSGFAQLTKVLWATIARCTWKYPFRGLSTRPCMMDRGALDEVPARSTQ